jgi:hypothetical protein
MALAPGGTTNRDANDGIAPPWLSLESPGIGRGLRYAFNTMLDGLQVLCRLGVRARFPQYAAQDALTLIGKDRVIDQGFAEPAAAYAVRLQAAPDTWATAGNPWSVLRNMLGIVAPVAMTVRLVTSTSVWNSMGDSAAPVTGLPVWDYYPPSPNWDWDGDQSSWWRFFAIIYPPSSLWTYGSTWGDGNVWGGYSGSWGLTADPVSVAQVRKQVATFKNAGTVCAWIIYSLDTALFAPTLAPGDPDLPDGTWGNWSKLVGYTRVQSRDTNARYATGVS